MTTLPLYWHLSSASKNQRIDASVKLIGALEHFQAQFVPKEGSGSEDEEDEADPIDLLHAQDVSYSIRRLIRGLASPRESSRLGFAVALTELLSRLDTVTCSQILALILDATKTQGSMTGQEERDVIFARLFGLTAIIQSGLIVRTKPLPSSPSSDTSASSESSFQETISNLVALGEKKSWLRESAWWSLGLAIDALSASEVPWKLKALDSVIERVFAENSGWSPEKVAITLKLQSVVPDRDWRKYLCPAFKTPDLLANANLLTLGKVLKEVGLETDSENGAAKSAASSWKPQLHFVWNVILDQLLPGPNSTVFTKGSFQEFFRVVVDETLFSSTSSQERKYSGFQVFQKALPRVTEDIMPMLFTKNFMRSWINHLSQPDRYLHKVAKQVATDITTFVQSQPQLGFSLILQLTGVNGSQQFDKLTKSKTVESILASMNGEGIKSYISHLVAQVNHSDDLDIQVTNSRRAWIIDQLWALIRNGAVPKEDDWIMTILDWLAVNGLFVVKKKSEKSPFLALRSIPSPPFSDDLRQQCRNRLLGCLADLSSQTRPWKLSDDRTIKCPAIASDGEFWVSKVIASVEKLKGETKRVDLLVETDENDSALHSSVRDNVQKLREVAGAQQEAAKGVELLLMGTLLQQYADEPTDADTATLEECLDASTRMFFGNKKKKSKKRQKEGEDAEAAPPEPVDILVDTIIGFLEKSTAYMRTVGNQVFSLIAGSVQASTVDLILTQLERRDPSELAREEESEDEEMGDADEEEASDSDSDSDVSDGVDEESEDGEVDLELRRKIEEALRVNGLDAASGDSDNDSEEDLMDDDQMLAVDEQLAQVFKMREGERKNSNVDAQREATHFKNRVLDLVDIFVKQEPASPLIVKLILPLVELSTGTSSDERHLTDKAKGILRSRIAKSKEVPSAADIEEVKSAMEKLHVRARKLHSPELLATLGQCSLFVAKILIEAGAHDVVVQSYRDSLQDFAVRKRSALNYAFIHDAIRRYPAVMWDLRQDILSLSQQAVNGYRRLQCLQLLQALITCLPSENQKDIAAFMGAFQDALVQSAMDACEEKVVLTPQQMRDVLKLGLFGVRQTQRVASAAESQKVWDSKAWEKVGKKLASSERFKASAGLHQTCQKLSEPPTQPAATKRKAASDNAGDENRPSKAKRKKTGN